MFYLVVVSLRKTSYWHFNSGMIFFFIYKWDARILISCFGFNTHTHTWHNCRNNHVFFFQRQRLTADVANTLFSFEKPFSFCLLRFVCFFFYTYNYLLMYSKVFSTKWTCRVIIGFFLSSSLLHTKTLTRFYMQSLSRWLKPN